MSLEVAKFSEANAARLREITANLGELDREATELRNVISGCATSRADTWKAFKSSTEAFEKAYPDSTLKFKAVADRERIKVNAFIPFLSTKNPYKCIISVSNTRM